MEPPQALYSRQALAPFARCITSEMTSDYNIRLATPDDAPALAEMRRRMFLDIGKADDERIRRVIEAFVPWVSDAIRRERYVGWVVSAPGGEIVSNAGLMLIDWPPNTRDLNPIRGYVLNVWTHPDHRRRGLARRLMDVVMAEARRRQIRVLALHASDQGRQMYEKLGFQQSREMMYVEPE